MPARLVRFVLLACVACLAQDPLPSWNDGGPKRAILKFVADARAVPADQRIATFDNDGTLWVEQPIYTQFAFMIDRVRALAPQHPEWRKQPPFQADEPSEPASTGVVHQHRVRVARTDAPQPFPEHRRIVRVAELRGQARDFRGIVRGGAADHCASRSQRAASSA